MPAAAVALAPLLVEAQAALVALVALAALALLLLLLLLLLLQHRRPVLGLVLRLVLGLVEPGLVEPGLVEPGLVELLPLLLKLPLSRAIAESVPNEPSLRV